MVRPNRAWCAVPKYPLLLTAIFLLSFVPIQARAARREVPAAAPKTVLVIDSGVIDAGELLAGVQSGVQVVFLNAGRDGVRQIADALRDYKNLSSIQIISHGAPGRLMLGSTVLNGANLDRYQAALRSWGGSLNAQGSILLYGCNVAQGTEGNRFVERIGRITHASVAASTDATGSPALGGNWRLEKQTASILAAGAISARAWTGYDHLLASNGTQTMLSSYISATNYVVFPSSFGFTFSGPSAHPYAWDDGSGSGGNSSVAAIYYNDTTLSSAVTTFTISTDGSAFSVFDLTGVTFYNTSGFFGSNESYTITVTAYNGSTQVGTATTNSSFNYTLQTAGGITTWSPTFSTYTGITKFTVSFTGNGYSSTYSEPDYIEFASFTVANERGVPGAPTIGTAIAGNGQASVAFTAPGSNGGAAITGYTATSSPGGFTGTCANSPCTVTGLTNGTAYTFTVTATNSVGTGPASSASNSVTPATVPGAPTIGTATAGNAQASVAFSAPGSNGGAAITGYTATSSPGGFTGTGSSSPIIVTGLSNGTSYTFTVTATNSAGTGPASSASNSVTPATVPGAPTIGTATAGNAQASVAFSAPGSNGGAAITGYTATASPGGFTGTGSSSPIIVTGLSNGTSYTFTVTATNSVGTGPASSASNSATPATVPGAPTIGTATAGNAQASVAFSAPGSNGGAAITGYTATSSPGSFTGACASSPCTVTGLTNGTTYTFTVTATNSAGTGPASSASNSVTPATVPDAPTIGTATAGNAQASVAFSAPGSNGGAAITGYTATSSPGGFTGTCASSPCTVTGLTGGTAYTFTVTATNSVGTGPASSASNVVTPVSDTVAPAVQSATAVDSTHVDVTFSETVTNGTTAANYTIDNGVTVSAAALQSGTTYRLTTSLLAVGTSYAVTVDAAQVKDIAGNSLSTNTASFSRTAALNSAPTIPSLGGPADAAEVLVTTPTLTVAASTDPDGDPVTYVYEIYADSGLSSLAAGTSGAGASWTVPAALSDNTTYWWRARATDGTASSGWMSTASFFVNTANDDPTVPVLSSPVGDTHVASTTPVLTVLNATDADGDPLQYVFEVASDGGYMNSVAMGVVSAGTATTGWTPTATLSDNRTYYWRCRAVDSHMATSNWGYASFFVNTANDAPTTPGIGTPANGSEVAVTTPTLAASNATDLDGDSLSYVFEVDRVATFNSSDKQASGLVSGGSGTTTWTPSALSDNTIWYWRVKANDGLADSSWSGASTFFVNTTNDAPGVPTLLNPASGSNVTVLGPTLAVNAATDADNDSLTYDFAVYADSGLTSLVTSTTGAGTSWVVSPALSDNTTYWWTSRAVDQHGLAGSWMAGTSFLVNNSGTDVAPAITIITPAAAEPITTGNSFTITWTDTDPDSNAIVTLGYDTTGSGCSGTTIVGNLSENDPANRYDWNISVLAAGSYYVYAVIDDGTTSVCSYAPGPLLRMTKSGDMNGDDVIDIADALKALRIAAGIDTATAAQVLNGDVAPLVNGVPQPDGVINSGDVVVILRKAVGLTSW